MEAVVKKKPKKKLIITLIVIAVVIAGVFGACAAMGAAAKRSMETLSAMQTGQVEVRDLIRSVGATGKVISLQSEDLTVNLTGVEIETIHVSVGDVVQAGQELVTFNTQDIAENLEMAQRALNQTKKRYEISAADAQRGVEDAVRNGEFQVDVAAQNADAAYEAYLNGLDDLEALHDSRWEALRAWEDLEEEYDDMSLRLEEVEQELAQLQEELERLQEAQPEDTPADAQDATVMELLEEISALVQERIELSIALPQLETALASAEASYDQLETAIETMERSVESMYDGYTTAVKNYDNMVAAQASAVAAAKSGQQSVSVSVNTDQQQQQVDLYAEQLEKGVLTAPFGGVITAVNYEAGDLYAQGPILTIQDCSGFEISAQIGEYDISDISLGQKVLIKTDATREQELKGTVVFVSPTATVLPSAMGMQTVPTDPTYEVKISVDTDTDRLRLDMSANLSIIISQHEDCLTVPYNAVQTAEDGSRFVEVVGEDDTKTVVPVEVVMESNYYTEISGQLTEGQKVRLIDEDSSIAAVFEAMASGMGGF